MGTCKALGGRECRIMPPQLPVSRLPDQAEQLEGQRLQVLAQKALGYASVAMLIQLLSHLPYFFCCSQE